MIESNFTINLKEKANRNFENIKESIKGLYEILNLTIPKDHRNSIYYEIGLENLSALYQNLLELLLNDYGSRDFIKRLKNSEVEMEIPFDDLYSEESEEANYSFD